MVLFRNKALQKGFQKVIPSPIKRSLNFSVNSLIEKLELNIFDNDSMEVFNNIPSIYSFDKYEFRLRPFIKSWKTYSL